MCLDGRKLQLSSGALREDGNSLASNDIELSKHQVKSDERNSDLSEDHLRIKLDEPPPAGLVKRPPGLNEECTASATDGQVNIAHDQCLVEWHNGLVALRKESSLDASEGHRGRQENSKAHEDVGGWDGEDAEPQTNDLGAILVVHCILEVAAMWMSNAERECDSDWQDDRSLLCNGVHQRWEKESLALLAGRKAAIPRLLGWVRDHLVRPCHMETCETERCEGVAEELADDAEAEEGGGEIGEESVEDVIGDGETKTSPSCGPATDTLEVADCSSNLSRDWLVVDDGDFDVDIGIGLGHQRLLLERRIGLNVGVRWRLRLDDGGTGRRFDHGKGAHHLADRIVNLCIRQPRSLLSVRLSHVTYRPNDQERNNCGDEDRQQLLGLDLHLGTGILVELRILLQLLDIRLLRVVLLRELGASLYDGPNQMARHRRSELL